jgi:hypothetical protein
MKKYITLLLLLLIVSCKKVPPENSEQIFKTSLNNYRINATDSIISDFNYTSFEKYIISEIEVSIYKKDSLNIDWLYINSDTINIKELRTINPRTDNDHGEMFCNSLNKIKFYKDYNLILLEFSSSPCTGLGCSVNDYIIYHLKNKETNLFGSFRAEVSDLYNFPFNSNINYLAAEFKGDPQGSTPMKFVKKIYSMNKNGKFILDNKYRYVLTTHPEDTINERVEHNLKWFTKH